MENHPPEDYASTFQTEDQLLQLTDELVGTLSIPRLCLSQFHVTVQEETNPSDTLGRGGGKGQLDMYCIRYQRECNLLPT